MLTGFGITVGYHRLFAHRSFEATRPLRVALAILGAMTLQGPVTQWVTDHRKHHARSDVDGDPHSPHLSGEGIVGAVRGLMHAHVGWLFSTKGMERGDLYGRDLFEDRAIRVVDRLYLLWVALSVVLPFLIAYGLTGSAGRGFEAMIWAGLIRIFVFEHATFAVNSICHTFGFRTYDAKDESTNNWVVGAFHLRRGMAQQPPRLSALGAPRARTLPDRFVVRGHPIARTPGIRSVSPTSDPSPDRSGAASLSGGSQLLSAEPVETQ